MIRICLLIFLISSFIVKVSCATQAELIFVHVLFRHGDRSPIEPYPSDPYANESFWPNGFGQLTNLGKRQQYSLGKWLRNRYTNFLPEKYSLKDIYVQSTDYDRTLMSAEANLAGLYAPNGTDVWNPDVKWQPIPIHTAPVKDDPVLALGKKCPRYDRELQEVQNVRELLEARQEMEPLLKYISNHTNAPIDTWPKLIRVYDNLHIQDINHYDLPDWVKPIYPSQLKRWFDMSYKIAAYNVKLQRFVVGLLLKQMLDTFVNKTNGDLSPDRKMWMYSAHDSNLANFLRTLDSFDDVCPPYASAVLLELYKLNSSYYVTAYYKNDSQAHAISILGCELFCPLNKVRRLLEPVILDTATWEYECEDKQVPFALTVVSIIGITCGALLLIILVSYCCCRKYLPHKFNEY